MTCDFASPASNLSNVPRHQNCGTGCAGLRLSAGSMICREHFKKTDIPERTADVGTIVPFPRPEIEALSPEELSAHPVCEPAFGDRLAAVQRRVGETLRAARSQIAATYRVATRHSVESYNHISLGCRSFVSNARYRARRAKDEQPLQLLGAMAGAAFIAGIVVRLWRSSRHA